MKKIEINNKSKSNYLFYWIEKNIKTKNSIILDFTILYNNWDTLKMNSKEIILNYTKFISENGINGSFHIPNHVEKFSILCVNIDSLYSNYQKGIPVDSFKCYSIRDYILRF